MASGPYNYSYIFKYIIIGESKETEVRERETMCVYIYIHTGGILVEEAAIRVMGVAVSNIWVWSSCFFVQGIWG